MLELNAVCQQKACLVCALPPGYLVSVGVTANANVTVTVTVRVECPDA